MKKCVSALMALIIMLILTVPAVASESSGFAREQTYTEDLFSDVSRQDWFHDNVQSAYELNLMKGMGGNLFRPEGHLTLAQTIAIACRIHGIHFGSRPDTSAPGEPWYAASLRYARANGIPTGDEKALNLPINRADFAVILSAALPDSALPVINKIEDGTLPDVNASCAYYLPVYRLYRAGILVGNDKFGTFAPDSLIIRGAAAAIASRMADPALRRNVSLVKLPFRPVPIDRLDNLKSLKQRCSDNEFQAAYNAALEIVTPLADFRREEQLMGIALELRRRFEDGGTYSVEEPHYNDPYGYLVLNTASCAGCTRATGLCLNILGIPYEHVNENKWSHQWARVNVNGTYWICDAFGLCCEPEPAPYSHPALL